MPGKLTTTILLTALLLSPVRAQEPAQEPAPTATAPEAPAAPETPAERQKNNAAKLAGLVAFVRANCADLVPNNDRFRSALAGLGVRDEDLETGDLRLRALTYAEVYGKDIPANCARATENFGANGRTIPDLFAKR